MRDSPIAATFVPVAKTATAQSAPNVWVGATAATFKADRITAGFAAIKARRQAKYGSSDRICKSEEMVDSDTRAQRVISHDSTIDEHPQQRAVLQRGWSAPSLRLICFLAALFMISETATASLFPGQKFAAGDNPSAVAVADFDNDAKAWNYPSYRRCWNAVCLKVGEDIAPQAGTRHSILSRLAEVLTPGALKSQSQHRSLQSLAHYTVGSRPNHAAMVQAIRPKSAGG
jgi:hypothetical protein